MRMFLVSALMLTLASCSSSKPDQKASPENDQDTNNGLVLHGSSDSGNAGGLRTVYFTKDSSVLTTQSKNDLKMNAEFLKKNQNVSVEIEGHCDERGGRQYNLSLGERRAKTTRDYLTALGADSKQITTISYGNEKPVSFGHSETEWAKNRRSNFSITAK